ncbi:MAG: SpoIIE family protein phosphatase [Bacteroidales bacterium]|nr:SpoIIE family protein phosphatase [Bacteroidales bacterium]
MSKKGLKYYLILFLFFNLIAINGISQLKAYEGKLDLSKNLFSDNQTIELNGVWEFYPSKLYSPADFKKGISEIPKFVSIPSLWNKNLFPESKKPNIGYGTYRLEIKIPDNIKIFALRLKRIESSYKLWVNSKLIVETGTVGTDTKSAVPEQKTITKIFSVDKKNISLIIQVSNFKHRKGGIVDPVIFGSADAVLMQTKKARMYELFIIGVMFIMAIFHFGLFAVRKQDFSLLFFALLLIAEIFSMSINGETLLTYYFPNTDWLTLKRIDYISNFARVTFFALFFYHIYKKYIHKYFIYAISVINVLLTIFVLLTNLQTFAFTLFVFIAVSAVTLIYVLTAQIRALIAKAEGALIPLIGNIVLLLTAVNDTLLVSGFINSVYLVPVGLFVFIFSQSYLLSFNFSKLYKHEEELNSLISNVEEFKNELLIHKSFDIYNSFKVLSEKLNADRAVLFSVNEKNEPVFKANFPKESFDKFKNPYPNQLILSALEKKQALIYQKFSGNIYYDKEYINKYSPQSSLTVPFSVSNKVRAVAYFERSNKKNPFIKNEGEVLEEIAAQIIGLIDNSELYSESENIRKNLEQIIEARTKDVSNQKDLLESQKDEIEAINNQLSDTLEEVKSKNEILTENIRSAQLIQAELLPPQNYLHKLFDDHFILFRPKEIVSGDFYRVNEVINKAGEKNIIFTLADCTGHGVPGVLMSLIGNDLISSTIINNKIVKPSIILNHIQKEINSKLGQTEEDKKVKDGMDMAVINFNPVSYMLEYAGAKIDLLIFRNNKLTEVKADRLSISAELHEKLKNKTFKNYKIQLKKGDILYLATDGYQDQFGGENDTKFMKKNFRLLLQELGNLQFNIQRSRLLKTINHWQGENIQNDDITVIGIKV